MQCISRISQRTGKSHIIWLWYRQHCLWVAQFLRGVGRAWRGLEPARQAEPRLCLCKLSLVQSLQEPQRCVPGILSSGSPLEPFSKASLCQGAGLCTSVTQSRAQCGGDTIAGAAPVFLGELGISLVQAGIVSVTQHWHLWSERIEFPVYFCRHRGTGK